MMWAIAILTMLLGAVLFLVSSIGAGLAFGVGDFILWRVVGGLGIGVASVVSPTYIAEVVPASVRGRLGSLQQLAITLGIFAALLSDALFAGFNGTTGAEQTLLFGFEAWRWMFLVGVVPGMDTRQQFLADRDRNFAGSVRAWPELAALVEGAERVGPLRVVADWRGYLRESAGPGWVLTGDAGNFKDPSAAQGIADALRQAETLAARLAAVLDTDGDVDRARA
jgi:MFS family permease